MNARDAIAEHLTKVLHLSERRDITDMVLDAVGAAGFVVVACPPGSRVVVSRESKPCATCEMHSAGALFDCPECGGSGVVEATTTYGLERPVSVYEKHTFPDGTHQMAPRYDLWEQVALPEETPK